MKFQLHLIPMTVPSSSPCKLFLGILPILLAMMFSTTPLALSRLAIGVIINLTRQSVFQLLYLNPLSNTSMFGLCLEKSICLASLIGGPTKDSAVAGPFLWERWAVRANVVGQKYQPGWKG